MKYLKDAYSGKRILITGGLGFMGSNLAHKLVEFDSDVVIFNREICTQPYGANAYNIEGIKDKVKLRIGDIRDDQIKELITGQDIIFHLAGQVGHYNKSDPLFQTYIKDAESINIDGTFNLLSLCRDSNPGARIIYAGSSFQYGNPKYVPVDEKHPANPDRNNLYATSKHQADILFETFHNRFGSDTVRLRIANPYGPRAQMKHPNYGFLNWFIRRAIDGQPIEIFGSGEQKKDMIYIDDLVDAFLFVSADQKTNGEVFNVGSGIGHSIKELAEIVVDTVGSGEVKFIGNACIPEKYKNTGMPSYISDISKIKTMTGWVPLIDIAEGIKRTIEFYRENRKYYW
ncbi:NAD-dependent epimerase/dehydratase family protein [Candidatus Woesearchaeota archaeon]|nr:NAD-dependent epimerase/dehydratase family protein [Candidatus Woesearchaeota archaeon]